MITNTNMTREEKLEILETILWERITTDPSPVRESIDLPEHIHTWLAVTSELEIYQEESEDYPE